MGRFLTSRFVIPTLMLASLAFSGCDSSSDSAEIRVAVIIEGSGTGRIESRSLFIEIKCRIEDGEVQVPDDCEDVFAAPDGQGTLKLAAVPSPTTNFSWGSPCRSAEGGVCEIEFDAGILNDIEIRAFFDARTRRIVMTPSSAAMTVPGDEGAIIVAAQAIDENDAEVIGVVYTWEVDRPDVVAIAPQNDPRRIKVTALADGQAVISATAQGTVGKSAVDVKLGN